MQVVEARLRRDALAVVHARLANVHLALVLAPHALDVDVQVQLSHAAYDRLAGLLVQTHFERRVFALEPRERLAEVGALRSRLGRHRQAHHRLRDAHGGHRDVRPGLGERVPALAVHAEKRHDLARLRFDDVLHLLGVHAH